MSNVTQFFSPANDADEQVQKLLNMKILQKYPTHPTFGTCIVINTEEDGIDNAIRLLREYPVLQNWFNLENGTENFVFKRLDGQYQTLKGN